MARLLLCLIAMMFFMACGQDALDRWIATTKLPALVTETSVEIRDRNQELLHVFTVENGRWRLAVTQREVDPDFVKMLIAYEDKRFYSHRGVDGWAMVRAIGQALWNREVVSGGSTLTMQVSRLLEDGSTGRWAGKIRQIRVAWALERQLSKSEILTLYLINAPYGSNIEGIRAATLAYFGKEPLRLTPAQSALLVAIPQSPTSRRPDRNTKAVEIARNRVLARMAGEGIITDETHLVAQQDTVPSSKTPFPAIAYHASNRAFRSNPLEQKHILTIDKKLQTSLETLAISTLQGQMKRVSIAMMVADYKTGEILALVGSPGVKNSEARKGFVDMTQAIRSPGSTLKPLIYAMAMDQGLIHPETLIDDRPVTFDGYSPKNFDGKYRGEIRVADALRQSLNIPVVLLTRELGPARLMASLRRAGTNPKLTSGIPGLAVSLGGVGMTLKDLVQLYGGLANGGKSIDLHFQRIDRAQSQTIVSRSAAWQVNHILSDLRLPNGRQVNRLAYKTGTSYGHRDAWAIGVDGKHVVGVWMGRADGTAVPGAFGGSMAAPVLLEAFQRLKPVLAPFPPPPPETLLVSARDLPLPLQKFRSRDAIFLQAADAPHLLFPPNGALLPLEGGSLTVKVRNGVAPFTWLANGKPVLTNERNREATLPDMGIGYTTLSIIDAIGRSSQVHVQIQ